MMKDSFSKLKRQSSKLTAFILFLSAGFLACESEPDMPPDNSSDPEVATGADDSFVGHLKFDGRPLEFWDTIVEPVDGDNRQHLRQILADKDNHRIFIRKGDYPISVLSKEVDDAFSNGQRFNLQIKNRENVVVFFEKGAKIKVNPNHFGTHSTEYSVLTINNSENISILNPTIEGDKYTHLDNQFGEWAAGITVMYNSENIHIKGADIHKMWGDGITVSQGIADANVWPENILIEDFKTIDNGRNGISVVCGKDITIRNGETSKNDRTPPKSGIDLEGPHSYTPMENFVIDNVKFRNNRTGLISFDGTGSALFKNLDVDNGMKIRLNQKKQIVKNSTFHYSDDTPYTSIQLYKTQSPVDFINNKVMGIRILGQKIGDEVNIKGNEFNPGRDTPININSGSYDPGMVAIKQNLIHDEGGSVEATDAAFININGTLRIINNTVNLQDTNGFSIGSKNKDVVIKSNIIDIENSEKSSFKIKGEAGASYDFSGNTPDISQYSTESLDNSINVHID